MIHQEKCWCAVVTALFCVPAARAATVAAGDHELQPNQPAQIVEIGVHGGDSVSGVDLFVQIGDGGPGLANYGLPGGSRSPSITQVELIKGTIFDGVTDAPTNLGSPDLNQIAMYTLALIGPTQSVPADGTLARLIVDTTGLYGGTWNLLLDNVLPFVEVNGPYSTNFAGLPARLENGHITIAKTIGDFDDDDVFGSGEIDALTQAIRDAASDQKYDVNGDNTLNFDDRKFWVESIARTYFGDGNLDGEFNTADLVMVFQAAEYEDDIESNSTWASGDWNGDAEFTTTDLVLAFQSGGFEKGPLKNLRMVPESYCRSVMLFAICTLLIYIGRSQRPVKIAKNSSSPIPF